jgi:hypothetical protein
VSTLQTFFRGCYNLLRRGLTLGSREIEVYRQNTPPDERDVDVEEERAERESTPGSRVEIHDWRLAGN